MNNPKIIFHKFFVDMLKSLLDNEQDLAGINLQALSPNITGTPAEYIQALQPARKLLANSEGEKLNLFNLTVITIVAIVVYIGLSTQIKKARVVNFLTLASDEAYSNTLYNIYIMEHNVPTHIVLILLIPIFEILYSIGGTITITVCCIYQAIPSSSMHRGRVAVQLPPTVELPQRRYSWSEQESDTQPSYPPIPRTPLHDFGEPPMYRPTNAWGEQVDPSLIFAQQQSQTQSPRGLSIQQIRGIIVEQPATILGQEGRNNLDMYGFGILIEENGLTPHPRIQELNGGGKKTTKLFTKYSDFSKYAKNLGLTKEEIEEYQLFFRINELLFKT